VVVHPGRLRPRQRPARPPLFRPGGVRPLARARGRPRRHPPRSGIDPDAFWPAFHAEEDPDARAEATYLHDDAARLLDRVDDTGGPTGLVTHCQRFLAEPVLDRLDLSDRFDAVVCCTDETGWKPDPDPIELAMTDLDVNPQSDRGYYVGDGESDVSAAWNAGLDAVHVERVGHEDRGRCVLGDRRVSRLDELLAGG